jgi:uncharacterized protein
MNLRRLALWALTACCLAGPVLAGPASSCPPEGRPPTAAEEAVGRREARDRGLLWRATKDGRTSWLYGTVHIGRLAWSFPGPTVREALKGSDVLALELDPEDPAVATRMQQAMAADPRLSLSPPLGQRLRRQLQQACLPVALADQIAPEMLGLTLTVMATRRAGFDAIYGIDLSLGREARSFGKPVHSLETVETQLAGLLSDNEADLNASVDRMLADLEQDRVVPMTLRLASAWEAGRDTELGDYASWCQCAETARDRALFRRLIGGRNPGLAEGIDRLHAGGQSVFAAVGGLHLVGPEGLPALLTRRGYTVTREPLPR